MTSYPSHANKIFLDEERRINQRAFKISKEYAKISNENIDPLTTAQSLNLVEFQTLINNLLVFLDSETSELGSQLDKGYRPVLKRDSSTLNIINMQKLTQSYNLLIVSLRKAYNDPSSVFVMKKEMQKLVPYLQILQDYYFGILQRLDFTTQHTQFLLRTFQQYNLIKLIKENIDYNSYNIIDDNEIKLNIKNSVADFGGLRGRYLQKIINENPNYWQLYERNEREQMEIKETTQGTPEYNKLLENLNIARQQLELKHLQYSKVKRSLEKLEHENPHIVDDDRFIKAKDSNLKLLKDIEKLNTWIREREEKMGLPSTYQKAEKT